MAAEIRADLEACDPAACCACSASNSDLSWLWAWCWEMDVPHSCHTTKSKMMAPTLRVQVKTWNHGDCTGVVGPVIGASSAWTTSTCAVGGSCRSTVTGSTTAVAIETGVVKGSATDAVGCAVSGRSWFGRGRRRLDGDHAWFGRIPERLHGDDSVGADLGRARYWSAPQHRGTIGAKGRLGRRKRLRWMTGDSLCRLPRRSDNSADRDLVRRRTVSGLPYRSPIDIRNVSRQVFGHSSARLGHDPLDEFRTQDPRVEAHVAPALGSVLGFEARGRHSHYAFMGTGTQADV